MSRPAFTFQALRLRVLLNAGWANTAGFKSMPRKAATTAPHILWLGFPLTQRAADFRASDACIRFILVSSTGMNIGIGLHHGWPLGQKWFCHTPSIVYDIDA